MTEVIGVRFRRSVLLTALLSVLASGCTPGSPKKPPNIIYLLADDLGYAEIGSYGQKWIRTPPHRSPCARRDSLYAALFGERRLRSLAQ